MAQCLLSNTVQSQVVAACGDCEVVHEPQPSIAYAGLRKAFKGEVVFLVHLLGNPGEASSRNPRLRLLNSGCARAEAALELLLSIVESS
jgi:hypothetical protein